MKAIVRYKGDYAYFSIKKETQGIYHADLLYYDGKEGHELPKDITLLKGMRQWTGSVRDKTLLNQIGKIIDEEQKKD